MCEPLKNKGIGEGRGGGGGGGGRRGRDPREDFKGVAHYLSERVTSLVLKTIDNRS